LRSVRRPLVLAATGVLVAAVLAPFLYMVSVSLMTEGDLLRWPPRLLPARLHTENYAGAMDALPFARMLVNTGIVAVCVAVGQVLTSAAAGYAFARMRFPGRDRVFAMVVTLLAVPAILLVIPRFLLIQSLGWTDSYAGLISTELVSVWGIVLMRQFFVALPRDVEDAARLDGAGEWTLFWRVALPLAKPAVAALAVIALLDQWRAFLWPLIVTQSPEMQVAELALLQLHRSYAANWPYQMAAAAIVTLPALLLCLVAHRYVTTGIRTAGTRLRL
jgi:ABC-type glycerol-3-phosphate transport system permease component